MEIYGNHIGHCWKYIWNDGKLHWKLLEIYMEMMGNMEKLHRTLCDIFVEMMGHILFIWRWEHRGNGTL